MKSPNNKWTFRARFRANAFGWRGTKLASQRLKEAVSEIKAVARRETVTAAEGAILLMEKLWAALAQIDTSSGALGNAVNKAVPTLIEIIAAAAVDDEWRKQWLERLWIAVEEDDAGYLWEVCERWGELCGTPERASRAAEDFLPIVRMNWSEDLGGYFLGTLSCLSCLLVAERHRELLQLIDTAPYLSWQHRRYGVRALAAMGRADDAIDYAQASLGLNDSPATIARACEEILLDAGRPDEAYQRFALEANKAGAHLATCRAIIKKYPHKDPREILDDLIASTPDDEGRWFAAAKALGHFELATELAHRSPVDIGTLLRAARDHLETNPLFALESATAALNWMARGRFYDIKAVDVWQARRFALQAAESAGRLDSIQELIACLLESNETDAFVRTQLNQPYGVRKDPDRS